MGSINQMLCIILLWFSIQSLLINTLKIGFYDNVCAEVETIVRKTTHRFISRDPSLAASLLRLHFHDCFVRGCDGSVLLNSTKDNQAEKEGKANLSVRGYEVIDAVKSKLEKKCPGVVSCADILALVARDAVKQSNGPFWSVPTGRRDGRVSRASDTGNLPAFNHDIAALKRIFTSKGLSVKDLAVLSGAHTIGTSRCLFVQNRLYNFTGKGDADPSLDPKYAGQLKIKCKPGNSQTVLEMDPGSFRTFDEDYYSVVAKRRGLFPSDAALLNDNETKSYVLRQVATKGFTFPTDFGESMVKMGNIGVLTGNDGEIRKHCAFVN